MGLQQNFQNEPVSRLALRDPVLAKPDETLRTAIERMREKKLGCTVVVDDDHKLVGVFTESTLAQLLNDQGTSVLAQPLERHILPGPWVRLLDPIAYVLDAMHLKNVRFLCVLDDEGRVIGLTGQKGLIEFVADHFPEQVMVQRIGGEPFPSKREGA